jgi:hypothetical protein
MASLVDTPATPAAPEPPIGRPLAGDAGGGAAPGGPAPRLTPWHRALRAVRPLHGLFALLVVASAVPLWAYEYLPFMDLPQHLATIAVLHDHGDPELGYAAFFEVDLLSTPYLAYYVATDLLAYLLPGPHAVETANRLFLTLYALLLPLGAWRFLAAAGRERALSLLAFPVIYGTFLFMGFVNFVAALPFYLFGLGALLRWLEHGRRRDWVWMVVHSLIVFVSHTQVYLLYLGSVGLLLLLTWPGLRRVLRAAAHLGPTLALFVAWVLTSNVLAGDDQWQAGRGGRNASPAGAGWEDLGTTVRELPARLVDAWRDSSDELLLVLLGFTLAVLLLLRRSPVPAPGPSGAGAGPWPRVRAVLRANALEILSLVLLALYVALPNSYKWIWPLNWRLVPVAYLVGLAWLRLPPLGPRARAALAVPLAALTLAGVWNHSRHFARFQEEVGPLAEVLAAAEPRRRTMGLIFDKGSGVVTPTLAPYLHFAQYYQLRRGGLADFSFANFAQSPIHFHERTGPPHLPLRWEWTPEQLRWPTHPPGAADYYDYYLVRGGSGRGPFGSALARGEVREVKQAGRWALYERVR